MMLKTFGLNRFNFLVSFYSCVMRTWSFSEDYKLDVLSLIELLSDLCCPLSKVYLMYSTIPQKLDFAQ